MPGGLLTFLAAFQDQKIRLYDWDGKALQEVGLLDANRGAVSALALSPDGLKLAAGDVSASSPPLSLSLVSLGEMEPIEGRDLFQISSASAGGCP